MDAEQERAESMIRQMIAWAHALWDWLTHGQQGEPPQPPIAPPKPGTPTPAPTPTPTPTPAPTPSPVKITVAWHNTDPKISNADVRKWVDAMNAQVPDIQALWPHVEECNHVFIAQGEMAPAGAVIAALKPTLPEAPGALGYHDVDSKGRPYIMVGSQTCIQAGVSIPSCMSHEACELTVDPPCTLTWRAPNGDIWAAEIGDPVESDSYNVKTEKGDTVEVSDFVGQAFANQGVGNLDKLDKATKPFTIAPGGYAIINGKQVFADGRVVDHGDPDDVADAYTNGYRIAGISPAKLAATKGE
jgi:hypothetical protein